MTKVSWLRRVSSFGTTFGMTMLMAGFGLTGIASAQTITNTGPGSQNNITSNMTNNCSVRNNTHVSASNNNYQTAYTGSAEVSDNTTAGSSWESWSSLDPHTAQDNGVGYSSWWNGVANWVAQHAGGQGWNSDEHDLSWMPNGSAWSDYNPMAWQANGQNFGNWYNGVESYLNTNNPVWALGWPANASGSGNFGGAMSGNASNGNNTNFSITINNAARTAAGVNACGQSNFVPPTCTTCVGGRGNGPSGPSAGSVSSVGTPVAHHMAAGGAGGARFGGFGSSSGGSGSFVPAVHHGTPAAVSSMPSGGAGGGTQAPAPCAPSVPSSSNVESAAAISNTGPGSSNSISSTATNNGTVRNTTTVAFTNSNTQKASTGDATVSGNTWASGADTGYAANDNGTGAGAMVGN